MSVFSLRLAIAGTVVLQLIASALLGAQAASPPAAEPIPADHLQMLEQRIDRLTEALTAAKRQVDEDHQRMKAMQGELEELQKTLAGNRPDSAEQANTSAAGQLQQAVTQIREEQDVLSAEVRQPRSFLCASMGWCSSMLLSTRAWWISRICPPRHWSALPARVMAALEPDSDRQC